MTTVRSTVFKDGRHCLSFYLDGKRHRETFSNLRDAQQRKSDVERLKGKGQKIDTKKEMAQDQSTLYAINLLTLKGIQKPLTSVVDEYTAAPQLRSTALRGIKVMPGLYSFFGHGADRAHW